LADQQGFRKLEGRDGGLSRHRGKVVQKLVQSLATFQVIQQRLERNARAAKDRSPSQDVLILNDDSIRLHIGIPFVHAHQLYRHQATQAIRARNAMLPTLTRVCFPGGTMRRISWPLRFSLRCACRTSGTVLRRSSRRGGREYARRGFKINAGMLLPVRPALSVESHSKRIRYRQCITREQAQDGMFQSQYRQGLPMPGAGLLTIFEACGSGSRSWRLKRKGEVGGAREESERHQIIPCEFLLEKRDCEYHKNGERHHLLNDFELES